MKMRCGSVLAALGASLVFGGAARAAFVVNNPSFESDSPNSQGTGNVRDVDGSDAYPNNPPGYVPVGFIPFDGSNNGTISGLFNPTGTDYTGATGTGTPQGGEGRLVGFTRQNDGFYQDLGAITEADVGNLLTLTVAVGDRGAPNFNGYTIGFRVGSAFGTATPFVTTSAAGPATNATFEDRQTTFTPQESQVGQNLFIVLQAAGTGAGDVATDFDNVRLTAVPEPASLGLLGAGALALVRRRR